MFKETIKTTIINTTKQFLTPENLNAVKIFQLIDVVTYLFSDIDFIIEVVKEENARFLWGLDFKLKNNRESYSHVDRKDHEQRRRIKQRIDNVKDRQMQNKRVFGMLINKASGFTVSQAAYCVLIVANAGLLMVRTADKVLRNNLQQWHLCSEPSPKNLRNALSEKKKVIDDIGIPLLKEFYRISNEFTEICSWLKSFKFKDTDYESVDIVEKEKEDYNLTLAIEVSKAGIISGTRFAKSIILINKLISCNKPVWPFGLNMKDSSKKKGKKK